MPRRRGARRVDDRARGYYVDFHEPRLFAVILSVVVLCVMDAYFTLALLQFGGQELNPFMRLLIEHDVQLFFVTKFVLTSAALIVLVIHKHFLLLKRFSGYQILYAFLIVYVALIGYELTLVRHLPLF